MLPSRTVILAEAKYARPFDQNLGFPLIYFFYLHTTIRLKYMFPFDFNLCARPFDQKSGFSLIYFFYVHTTIRPKYIVFFHLFFLLCTTIRPRSSVLTDLFICTQPFDKDVSPSFIYSFFVYDHSTKIRVLIYLFLLFVHDHSTKLFGPLSFILFLFRARPFDQKLGSL